MNRAFVLEGLDCPNCAAQIEGIIGKLPCITYSNVNFISTTLRIEHEANCHCDIATKICKIVRDLEPEVSVKNKDDKQVSSAKNKSEAGISAKRSIVRLAAGAAVFTAALILSRVLSLQPFAKLSLFLAGNIILGGDVLLKAARNIIKGRVFDENFLMSLATIGAFIIGEYPEAAGVMLFYQVGELFQETAVRRSKKSIASLMDIRPDIASVMRNGELLTVAPETVAAGETIVIRPGEKIPLDGVVIEGKSMLDTCALTGESVPRSVKPGETALSGCINQNGVLTVEVTKTFGESTAAKIIDLVENAAAKKAPTENFITAFSRYYTPAVVSLAALLAVIPPLFAGGSWMEWANRSLIFLVISCPCALVISIPLGFFGGIGGASRKGVLVKGGNYLEALNKLDIIVFDKTGTLTKGVFKVTQLFPAASFTEASLLECAARAEAFSNHPIAISIKKACSERGIAVDEKRLVDYSEISGCGVSVAEGGVQTLAGNEKLMKQFGIIYTPCESAGTKVYAALGNRFAGCIVISDEAKPDSKEAIASLKKLGVRKTVMLTGDNAQIGNAIAVELGLDEVHAELLPAEKAEKIELLDSQKKKKGKLAFVGDGINDAPALARADIGIAMGGLGSDAAIEAADVVLMTDEPSKLIEAIGVARFTKRVIWQNIIFAMGVKGAFLLLGTLGEASMWEAVFADVGVASLAILNAARVIRVKQAAPR
ncbi:MAG: cadmium-translocating P-type ATPase [Treponema sp.]|jgi:Cd2+/Zn2+-exporting ATPase|nr:cadmium-translocating P-type ATPase [Treponema sp.]